MSVTGLTSHLATVSELCHLSHAHMNYYIKTSQPVQFGIIADNVVDTLAAIVGLFTCFVHMPLDFISVMLHCHVIMATLHWES